MNKIPKSIARALVVAIPATLVAGYSFAERSTNPFSSGFDRQASDQQMRDSSITPHMPDSLVNPLTPVISTPTPTTAPVSPSPTPTPSASATPAPVAPTINMAAPGQVTQGQSFSVNWSASPATHCARSGSGWSGSANASGTFTRTMGTSDLMFLLECFNGTASATDSEYVRTQAVTSTTPAPTAAPTPTPTAPPSPPQFIYFRYNPAGPVTAGTTVRVQWNVSNATHCVTSGVWGSNTVNPSGDVPRQINQSQTNTLTCYNGSLSASRSAEIRTEAVSATPAPTPTPAPQFIYFRYNPAGPVAPGTNVRVQWSVTNATRCVSSGQWGSGAKPVNGDVPRTVNQTQTNTLTCYNGSSSSAPSATQSATITASEPAPTLTLTSNRSSITQGQDITLTWAVSNTSPSPGCQASGAWSGGRAWNGGSQTLTPSGTGNKNFTLTCSGPGGQISRTVTVNVQANPAPTLNFTVNRDHIERGQGITLRWTVTNTAPSPGCQASGAWSGGKSWNGGAQNLSPGTGNKNYTLTCSGPGGQVSRTVTVRVDPKSCSGYPRANGCGVTFEDNSLTAQHRKSGTALYCAGPGNASRRTSAIVTCNDGQWTNGSCSTCGHNAMSPCQNVSFSGDKCNIGSWPR